MDYIEQKTAQLTDEYQTKISLFEPQYKTQFDNEVKDYENKNPSRSKEKSGVALLKFNKLKEAYNQSLVKVQTTIE